MAAMKPASGKSTVPKITRRRATESSSSCAVRSGPWVSESNSIGLGGKEAGGISPGSVSVVVRFAFVGGTGMTGFVRAGPVTDAMKKFLSEWGLSDWRIRKQWPDETTRSITRSIGKTGSGIAVGLFAKCNSCVMFDPLLATKKSADEKQADVLSRRWDFNVPAASSFILREVGFRKFAASLVSGLVNDQRRSGSHCALG